MSSDRKQITRTRISYSCQTCRRRKVKCDKTHPVCGGCQRVGETCVYGDSESTDAIIEDAPQRKRKAEVSDGAPDGQTTVNIDMASFRALENKLNNLNALMDQMNGSTTLDKSKASRDTFAPWENRQVFPSLGSIYSAQHVRLRNSVDQTDAVTSAQANATFDTLLMQLDQLNTSLKQSTSLLSNYAPSTTLGEDPRANISRQPSEQLRQEPYTLMPEAHESDDFELRNSPFRRMVASTSDNDLLAPTEEECNVLFRSWLWSTYAILPLISPHEVLRKYRQFRAWYESGLDRGEPNPDPSFMPLLYTIWYAGLKNLSAKGHQKWFSWAKTEQLTIAMRTRLSVVAKTSLNPSKPTAMSVAAGVYFAHIFSQDYENVQNSADITTMIRAAQLLGLHNERSFQNLPLNVAESRRRLFWESVHADVSLSAASGMPPILDESYTDTALPSELKECFVGTDDSKEYEAYLAGPGSNPDRTDDPISNQSSSLVSVHHLVSRARYVIAAATRKILKFNMRAQPMTKEDMKSVRLIFSSTVNSVRAIIDRIATRGMPEMDFVPQVVPFAGADHQETMGAPITTEEIDLFLGKKSNPDAVPFARQHRMAAAAFHKWARIALSLMVDRLSCVSYAPFLKNAKSRLWGVARNCALRDCHAYMRKFISLGIDPELERFRWCWSTLFQPMHAAIIILIDVYERPFSTEAPRSRAFIDKIFSLAAPESGIVGAMRGRTVALPLREGGEEAWTMLRKLRHKAWQKAGLNPDLLWTEEEQVQVGVSAPLTENQRFAQSLREDVVIKFSEITRKEHHDKEGANSTNSKSSLVQKPTVASTWHQDYMHPLQTDIRDIHGASISDSNNMSVPGVENGAEKQQHLLLRARHDQQAMPFPVGKADPLMNGDAALAEAWKPVIKSHEDGQMTHVADLIKKIKAMKTDAKKAQNQTQGLIPGPEQSAHDERIIPLIPDSTDQHAGFTEGHFQGSECGFRTTRELENAALSDILDRSFITHHNQGSESNNQTPSKAPDNGNGSKMELRKEPQHNPPTDTGASVLANIPTFRFLPQPPLTDSWNTKPQETENTNPTQPKNFTPNIQQYSSPPNATRIIFLPSRLQPLFADTTWQSPTSSSEPATLPGFEARNGNHQDTLMSGNTFAPLDTEFDWDKWDEVFSSFTGYEDLLSLGDDSWITDENGVMHEETATDMERATTSA